MTSHFHFLIIVVSVTSQVQLQWIMTHLFLKINFSTHAAFTSAPDVPGWMDQLTSCMCAQQFSKFLHQFLIRCSHIIPLPYAFINWQWSLLGVKYATHKTVSHYKLVCGTKLSMLLPLSISSSYKQLVTDWLMTINCMFFLLQVLPPTKECKVWLTHIYRPGNITYWICLICHTQKHPQFL